MHFLQQTVKAGWKDATQMAEDTDLVPLREREDFKRLLAVLEPNLPTPPEKK
jgi:hypothetical protein